MVGAAVGIAKDTMERIDALIKANVDVIAVDTAHGHSQNVINLVKKIKSTYPDLQLIAGNVATAEATRALIDAEPTVSKWVLAPDPYALPVLLPVSVYLRLLPYIIAHRKRTNMVYLLLPTAG